MQDALGRTSLMFAVGNNAEAAVQVLLMAGASLSQRQGFNLHGVFSRVVSVSASKFENGTAQAADRDGYTINAPLTF